MSVAQGFFLQTGGAGAGTHLLSADTGVAVVRVTTIADTSLLYPLTEHIRSTQGK